MSPKKRRKKKKKRICLRCDGEFFSYDDRTCPNCQEANANFAGSAEGFAGALIQSSKR